MKTAQLEAKLLARLTTAKVVIAQQATEDVQVLSGAAEEGWERRREENPELVCRVLGHRRRWLSSSDIKICLCLAKGTCSGRKGAGAGPGSCTGAAGWVSLGWATAQRFCLDSGLQRTKGESAAALPLTTFIFLISVLWEIPSP